MEEFCRREWKDSEKILGLDRDGLLWQIWKERSSKLQAIIFGVFMGMCIMSFIWMVKGIC